MGNGLTPGCVTLGLDVVDVDVGINNVHVRQYAPITRPGRVQKTYPWSGVWRKRRSSPSPLLVYQGRMLLNAGERRGREFSVGWRTFRCGDGGRAERLGNPFVFDLLLVIIINDFNNVVLDFQYTRCNLPTPFAAIGPGPYLRIKRSGHNPLPVVYNA